MSPAPRLKLALASLLLSVLAAEAGLRLAEPVAGFYPSLSLRPHRRMRVVLASPVRGVSPSARYTTNSLGLRGDEPPQYLEGRLTVVAIGGSTTECYLLDDAKTWPRRLQEELQGRFPGAWVGNAAQSGDTSRSHLLTMRQLVGRLKPRLAVVLAGINDLAAALSPDGTAGGNPAALKDRLLASSRLLQLARRVWRARLGTPVMRQDVAAEARPLRGPAARPPDPAELLPSLAAYRGNMKAVLDAGRAAGARILFLTQPTLYRDAPRWRNADSGIAWPPGSGRRLSAADEKRLLDLFNRELLELCSGEGAECLDLASRVPPEERYFYDAVHFTEAGAERVAREVAHYLSEHPDGAGDRAAPRLK